MILSLLLLSGAGHHTESNYYNITFFQVENLICLIPEFWVIFIFYSPLPPFTSLF